MNEAEAITEASIFERIGQDSRHIRETIRQLMREGIISRVGKGGQRDPFRYHASKAAQ